MAASFIKNDLCVILSQKDFGNTGGIKWNGVDIEDVIFDDEDIEVQMGEGVAEIVPRPMLTGKTSDFIGILEDDAIQVNGETFTVKNWEKDGTGVIEIFLSRDK